MRPSQTDLRCACYMKRVLRLVKECRSVLRPLSAARRNGRVIERRGRADSLLHANERHRRGAHTDDGGCAQSAAPREPAAWADGHGAVGAAGASVRERRVSEPPRLSRRLDYVSVTNSAGAW